MGGEKPEAAFKKGNEKYVVTKICLLSINGCAFARVVGSIRQIYHAHDMQECLVWYRKTCFVDCEPTCVVNLCIHESKVVGNREASKCKHATSKRMRREKEGCSAFI